MVGEASVEIAVTFTEQQMLLLDKLRKEGTFGENHEEIVARVFRENVNQNFGAGGVPSAAPAVVARQAEDRRRQREDGTGMYGPLREDFLVQPISGKALPVRKGEVLRIVQEGKGQCVDFNAWNLHDRREFMDTSIMRRQGFHLRKGHFLISNSPRNRLLMQIIEASPPPANCVDVLVHRCSRALLEAVWDVENHSNCQDSLAEAIGEYRLTPDDTHAVLCPWTPTSWSNTSQFRIRDNRAAIPGDFMDFLALEDVLTANCICGVADYSGLGNYFPEPIRLQVFEASSETEGAVQRIHERYPPLRGQLKPEDYQVRYDHEEVFGISHDPDYEPQFHYFPQKTVQVRCKLTAQDYDQISNMLELGLRDSDEDAVRTAVMEWYFQNRTTKHPLMGGEMVGIR